MFSTYYGGVVKEKLTNVASTLRQIKKFVLSGTLELQYIYRYNFVNCILKDPNFTRCLTNSELDRINNYYLSFLEMKDSLVICTNESDSKVFVGSSTCNRNTSGGGKIINLTTDGDLHIDEDFVIRSNISTFTELFRGKSKIELSLEMVDLTDVYINGVKALNYKDYEIVDSRNIEVLAEVTPYTEILVIYRHFITNDY